MERIKVAKHARADRSYRTRKLREVNTAFKEMTNILRSLRVKSDVLKQNVNYLRAKRATQKWFLRTKLTLYLRKRNEQVI